VNDPYVAVWHDNDSFAAEIEYAISQLLEILGCSHGVIDLSKETEPVVSAIVCYAQERCTHWREPVLHIRPSRLFGNQYLRKGSLPAEPLRRFEDIPILYLADGEPPYAHLDETGLTTNIDLIASSFFLLAQYEEYVCEERDPHGRLPARAILAYREGFMRIPIVNEYVELLRRWLSQVGVEIRSPRLPSGHSHILNVTHDVDRIALFSRGHRAIRAIAHSALLQRSPRRAIQTLRDFTATRQRRMVDPFSRFGDILALERTYGATSTFFFMAGGASRKYDNRYSLDEVRDLVAEVQQASCEVGLHGSYLSHTDVERLRAEKASLQEVVGALVHGNRQHYLRWKLPESLRVVEGAGFRYDTTVGFVDDVGFRSGVCCPYQPFDIVARRALAWREVPLAIMENSLFGKLRVSAAEALQLTQGMIDVVCRHGGVLTLLWHTHMFYHYPYSEAKDVFTEILEYAKGKAALLSSSGDALNAWESARPTGKLGSLQE
jgi:peptidoglycan/xylan/chitin deacetylase (PgdA/CDA1 family)